MQHPLILASSSPRRHQLLTMLGIPHRVEPANVQEIRLPRETPAAYVRRLARDKSRAIPGAWVDYAQIVDADSLQPIGRIDRPAVAAVAVRLGTTRLIDNVVITPHPPS